MRIRYVCADRGIPVFGTKGASVHVQEVIRVLRDMGHDVELWTSRVGGEAPADLTDLQVRRLPMTPEGTVDQTALASHPSWGKPEQSPTTPRITPHHTAPAVDPGSSRLQPIETGPSLVYERYSLWGGHAMAWAARTGVPAILEVNAPLIAEHLRHRGELDLNLAQRHLRLAFDHATLIVCVSEPVAEWVRSELPPKATGRVFVQPNGVDTSRFVPRSTSCEDDASLDDVVVGFVGTLKPWHGVENLIEAFAEVSRARPGVRLVLIGDGPERENLEALATELGIASLIRFVGAVQPANMPGMLRDLDIAVAPYPASENDYFSPLKVFEYLSAGLPVVASSTGQIPQLLSDGRTGLLVPPSDIAALAAALAKLADSPHVRARLGAAAREYAVLTLSWHFAVTNILEEASRVPTSVGGTN